MKTGLSLKSISLATNATIGGNALTAAVGDGASSTMNSCAAENTAHDIIAAVLVT